MTWAAKGALGVGVMGGGAGLCGGADRRPVVCGCGARVSFRFLMYSAVHTHMCVLLGGYWNCLEAVQIMILRTGFPAERSAIGDLTGCGPCGTRDALANWLLP